MRRKETSYPPPVWADYDDSDKSQGFRRDTYYAGIASELERIADCLEILAEYCRTKVD